MSDLEYRMAAFENLTLEKNILMTEFPETCFVGTVYHVVEGRNAWRNKRSCKYTDDTEDSSFQTLLSWAQGHAAKCRVQGSQWSILERACCVFASDWYSLIVTEINTPRPLLRFDTDERRIGPPTLYELASSFAPCFPNSVIRLVTKNKDIMPWSCKPKLFASRSQGGSVALKWIQRENSGFYDGYEISHIARIVDRVGASIQDPASTTT